MKKEEIKSHVGIRLPHTITIPAKSMSSNMILLMDPCRNNCNEYLHSQKAYKSHAAGVCRCYAGCKAGI